MIIKICQYCKEEYNAETARRKYCDRKCFLADLSIKMTGQKSTRNYKHGMNKKGETARFYRTWADMKTRCGNSKNKAYRYYGAKGIKVCDRWQNFENFKDDMYTGYLAHEKEHGAKDTFIDRKDPKKDYSPENCRWATKVVQANNTSYNHIVEYKGIKMNTTQWAKKLGMTGHNFRHRLARGWSIERAITTPLR